MDMDSEYSKLLMKCYLQVNNQIHGDREVMYGSVTQDLYVLQQ
jgi:hypothetical protein